MEVTIESLKQIKESYANISVQDLHKKYQGEDEFRKIGKQKKSIKTAELNVESPADMLQKIKKFLNHTKQLHKEVLSINKKWNVINAEKERISNENTKVKNQIKILDSLKGDLNQKINEKQNQYNQTAEQEKQLKVALVDGFQLEIKEIQTKMEQVATNKHMKQQENVALKQKLVEIQEHIDKRDKLFEEELIKLETQKNERTQKIDEQMQSIFSSIGTPENVEETLQKMKEEEELVDAHLNPNLAKTEEFQKSIEITNQQFNTFKIEQDQFAKQREIHQKQITLSQRKCEQSDILLVGQVKEYQRLKDSIKQKSNQLATLQSLLSSLQAGEIEQQQVKNGENNEQQQ